MRAAVATLICCASIASAQKVQPEIDFVRAHQESSRVALSRELIDSLLQKEALSSGELALVAAASGPRELSRLSELARSKNEALRIRALFGLALNGDARSIAVLEDAARDDSPRVREEALHGLSIIDARAGHESFMRALDDPVAAVVQAALTGIAASESPELWQSALEHLRKSNRAQFLLVSLPYAPASVIQSLGESADGRTSGNWHLRILSWPRRSKPAKHFD